MGPVWDTQVIYKGMKYMSLPQALVIGEGLNTFAEGCINSQDCKALEQTSRRQDLAPC